MSGGNDDTIAGTGTPVSPRDRERKAELSRGEVVGRYVVLEKLGAGGMGVVYAAYDPELDRKVALKLLLPQGDAGAGDGHRRLVREAQAMAQLGHPNVVAVHDVGEHEGRVFLAMEFVQGDTFKRWSEVRPRRWPEVLTVLVAAGRGLAAAHERGLIHRDFKPDNVMVADDGRVRVMDFGLARTVAKRVTAQAVDDTVAQPRENALAVDLTRRGAMIGTPAYMAPEQFREHEATAAADQFAYCVTFWEAVYGQRPFAGGSLMELASNVLHGAIATPPAERGVPRWLRVTLERGLRIDPADRHACMVELLFFLERGSTRHRRAWRVGAAAGVVLLATVGVRMLTPGELCPNPEDKLAGVWDAQRRAALDGAFSASPLPFAEHARDVVVARFDGYAADWARMHVEACEATNVRGEQSSTLLDARMLCLEQRRVDLGQLVDVLSNTDAAVLEHAVEAAASLRPLASCADAERLLARLPPPDEPERAEAVARVRERVARGRALAAGGKLLPAVAQLGEVCAEVGCDEDEGGYPPVRAEASAQLGRVLALAARYDEAERALRRGFAIGLAIGHDEVVAETASQLVPLLGQRLDRQKEGWHWAEIAGAAVERARLDDNGRGELESHVALLHHAASRFEEALAHEQRADELFATLADQPQMIAVNLSNMGATYAQLGRFEESEAAHLRALDLRNATLGEAHPDVADSLTNLGKLAFLRGDYASARARFEQAIDLTEAALGPSSLELPGPLVNLGNVLEQSGDYSGAEAVLERALAIQRAGLGSEHADLAFTLIALGNVQKALRQYEPARNRFGEALALRERQRGPDDLSLAVPLGNLASLDFLEGRYADAERRYARALKIRERGLGPKNPALAYPLTGLGQVMVALGRPQEALPLLERALELRTSAGVGPLETAETQYALATALVRAGQDRGRAQSLAAGARAAFVAGKQTERVAELDRWRLESDL